MTVFALHIPDGFMSVTMAVVGWLLAVPVVGLALRGSRSLEDRFVPVAGLLAAFVFAAQTIQFPIPGGTTGHLVGASLVTILLGPAMGMVVLSAVLLLEAVVFGTGGLLALGWNSVNMVAIMGLTGSAIYHAFRDRGASVAAAAFWSGWIATQFGSLVTCLELAAAGTSPLEFSLPAMMTTQALVGVGEGLVTASAVTFLGRSRPDLIFSKSPGSVRLGFLVMMLVALSASLPASVYGLQDNLVFWQRYLGLLVAVGLGIITFVAWLGCGLGRRSD